MLLFFSLQLCHSSKSSMAQSSPSTPFIDIMDSGSIVSGSVESTNIHLQAPGGGAWACVRACTCMDCDRLVTFPGCIPVSSDGIDSRTGRGMNILWMEGWVDEGMGVLNFQRRQTSARQIHGYRLRTPHPPPPFFDLPV